MRTLARMSIVAFVMTACLTAGSSELAVAAQPSPAACARERQTLYAGELAYRDMYPARYVSEAELQRVGYIPAMSKHYNVELLEDGNRIRIVHATGSACRSTPGVSQ